MLKIRSQEREIIDDLNVSGPVVDQTLRELGMINRLLGGNQISVSAFKKIVEKEEKLTLADVGCGGGDIIISMSKWAGNHKLAVSFVGIDANPNIIKYAKQRTAGCSNITFQTLNIFSDEFKYMTFDIIHCCLFIHHFTNQELAGLFRQFRSQARIGVIINDLHRHPMAYWSIKWLTTLFSKSEMVRNDAAISVARGFRKSELEAILEQAEIVKYSLVWKWAFRWKLIF